jgi:hypothetical protein
MTPVDVEHLLRDLVPIEKGTVSVEDSLFGPVITVAPTNPNGARITFNVSEGEVAGTIGINTPIEVASNQSRYSSMTGLAELAAIAETVVLRGFVEKIWVQWGRVTKSRARIDVEGQVHTICDSTIWRIPFYASEVVEVRHEPY